MTGAASSLFKLADGQQALGQPPSILGFVGTLFPFAEGFQGLLP